jgi:hypothetical protein
MLSWGSVFTLWPGLVLRGCECHFVSGYRKSHLTTWAVISSVLTQVRFAVYSWWQSQEWKTLLQGHPVN